MIVYILRWLGVTSGRNGKTGKREAAWVLVAMALGMTVWSVWLGVEMVQAMTALLIALWASAITALAGAYKLEHDKQVWLKDRNDFGQAVPPGYPADIAAPDGYRP